MRQFRSDFLARCINDLSRVVSQRGRGNGANEKVKCARDKCVAPPPSNIKSPRSDPTTVPLFPLNNSSINFVIGNTYKNKRQRNSFFLFLMSNTARTITNYSPTLLTYIVLFVIRYCQIFNIYTI